MPRRSPRSPVSRPPVQERARATVDAILVAAARVVARDGYENAKMATIAERAGVSVGSIYQYFPSKEALVAALIRAHVQHGWELFLKQLEAVGSLSLHDAVRALVGCAVDAYAEDPALFKVIFEQVPRAQASAGLPDFGGQLVEMLWAYLGPRSALVRRPRLLLALRIAVTAVVDVVGAMTAADPTLRDRDAIADEVADLLTRYLLVDPPPTVPS